MPAVAPSLITLNPHGQLYLLLTLLRSSDTASHLDDVGALNQPVLECPQAALPHRQCLLARQAACAARQRHAWWQEGQEVVMG